MDKITLYYFEGYDFRGDMIVRSKRPATMGFIEKYRFVPVHENTVEVDTSQVDDNGMLAGDS